MAVAANYFAVAAEKPRESSSAEARRYVCGTCQATFTRKHNLKAHTQIHTEPKRCRCEVLDCARSFRRASDLRRHMKTHSRERAFRCESCGKSLSRADALARHVNSATCINNGRAPFPHADATQGQGQEQAHTQKQQQQQSLVSPTQNQMLQDQAGQTNIRTKTGPELNSAEKEPAAPKGLDGAGAPQVDVLMAKCSDALQTCISEVAGSADHKLLQPLLKVDHMLKTITALISKENDT